MARHLKRNFYESAGLHQEGVFRVLRAQPAKSSYTWMEVFGDVEDEDSVPGQPCEINSSQFYIPEVDVDEFESVYLWFLA
jgi:glycogen debranching enzyme